MTQAQRPGSITAVNNLIKEGFSYLRSGGYQGNANFFKRGLSYLKPSRYTQKRKPAAALAEAAHRYSLAENQLDRVSKPGDDAPAADKQRYDGAVVGLEMLKTELLSYAKMAAKKIDDEAARLVSKAERAERQYERGRKILGVPYWKRPSSDKVQKNTVNAWHRISESMEVTDVNATTGQPTGRKYFTKLQGDLQTIQQMLQNAKLYGDAEGKYLADLSQNFLDYRGRLAAVEKARGSVAEQRLSAKTKKKEDKELRKTEREGEKDFKRHMKALKKHKW